MDPREYQLTNIEHTVRLFASEKLISEMAATRGKNTAACAGAGSEMHPKGISSSLMIYCDLKSPSVAGPLCAYGGLTGPISKTAHATTMRGAERGLVACESH